MSESVRKMLKAKLVVLGRDNCGKTGNTAVFYWVQWLYILYLDDCNNSVFLFWTPALCVRFITRRFIGEYEHKRGNTNEIHSHWWSVDHVKTYLPCHCKATEYSRFHAVYICVPALQLSSVHDMTCHILFVSQRSPTGVRKSWRRRRLNWRF